MIPIKTMSAPLAVKAVKFVLMLIPVLSVTKILIFLVAHAAAQQAKSASMAKSASLATQTATGAQLSEDALTALPTVILARIRRRAQRVTHPTNSLLPQLANAQVIRILGLSASFVTLTTNISMVTRAKTALPIALPAQALMACAQNATHPSPSKMMELVAATLVTMNQVEPALKPPSIVVQVATTMVQTTVSLAVMVVLPALITLVFAMFAKMVLV